MTSVGTIDEGAPSPFVLRGVLRSQVRMNSTGVAFGAVFFCWSLTPSLLPRSWLFQGVVSGINAAIGYGIGLVIGSLIEHVLLRRRPWWPLSRSAVRITGYAVWAVALVAGAIMLAFSAGWQRELAALMGDTGTSTTGYFRTGLLSVAVAWAVITVARSLRFAARAIARRLLRWTRLSRPVATGISVAVVVLLVVGLVQGVLLQGLLSVVSSVSSLQNDSTRAGVVQPTESTRSGSPESAARWDTLGYQGRVFVAGGLSAAQITALSGRPAREPIRAYVGLKSAPTQTERMASVVRELERTGAFTRKAIVVMGTTGTGWVNPLAVRSLELMYDGDVAVIATQYSYLPSWVSFLVDRRTSELAGKALIDTVTARWSAEPAATRPKLYVWGESLGSFAGEAAFTDITDIRSRVDGVVWVGPPNFNRIWRTYTDRRDPGTPEVEPVYAGGLLLRFAGNDASLTDPQGQWSPPRVLYVQHPSDPITWWSPNLLFERPDWLAEPPGSDRLASMRWFPIVTFWQVSADLTNSLSVPSGHGHNYGDSAVAAWAAVAAPPGWSAADSARVERELDQAGQRFPEAPG